MLLLLLLLLLLLCSAPKEHAYMEARLLSRTGLFRLTHQA